MPTYNIISYTLHAYTPITQYYIQSDSSSMTPSIFSFNNAQLFEIWFLVESLNALVEGFSKFSRFVCTTYTLIRRVRRGDTNFRFQTSTLLFRIVNCLAVDFLENVLVSNQNSNERFFSHLTGVTVLGDNHPVHISSLYNGEYIIILYTVV